MSNLKAAQEHLTDLARLHNDPELSLGVSAASAYQTVELFRRAHALLYAPGLVPVARKMSTPVYSALDGSITRWRHPSLTGVRQIVLPVRPLDNVQHDLVLSNTIGNSPYVMGDKYMVGEHFASLCLRSLMEAVPSYKRSADAFSPGQELFHLDVHGNQGGPVSDHGLIAGYLEMFEAPHTDSYPSLCSADNVADQ